MSRECLGALAGEVRRLLASGERAAASDGALDQRARALVAAAGKVPALVPVAGAATRLADGAPPERVRAMLDLNVLLGMVWAGLATAGAVGTVEPVAPSGPWATATPSAALPAALAALRQPGHSTTGPLATALQAGTLGDLRVLSAALRQMEERPSEYTAHVLAGDVLPTFGRAALPELEARLNVRGGDLDARWLQAVVRIDSRRGAVWCRQALRAGSQAVKRQALREAAGVLPPKEVLAAAVRLLKTATLLGIKEDCLRALGKLGPAAAPAVPTLIEALDDSGASIRGLISWEAARALGRIGKPALGPLIEVLRSPVAGVREHAAGALREMGAGAADAVPALVERLYDAKFDVACSALYALRDIGAPARAAVPTLLRLVEEGGVSYVLRYAAAGVAVALTGGSKAVVGRLLAVARDAKAGARVRAGILNELSEAGCRSAAFREALGSLSQDKAGMVRRAATEALRKFDKAEEG
jgi:HEAT repeat protein